MKKPAAAALLKVVLRLKCALEDYKAYIRYMPISVRMRS